MNLKNSIVLFLVSPGLAPNGENRVTPLLHEQSNNDDANIEIVRIF